MSILGEAMVKVAVSQGRLRMSKSRKGRRPMRVDTFLRKEKEGTLYRKHAADWEAMKERASKKFKRVKKRLTRATGVEPEDLSRQRIVGTTLERMQDEFEDVLDKESAAHADTVHGGLADKKKPSSFKPKQLRKGTKVEMEHTNNSDLAKEIAMDHLEEHPEYYTHLERMEKRLEKKAGSNQPMQRMFGEGGSRGVQSQTYIMEDSDLQGKPASSKTKSGDSPSRDESPTYVGTENQVFPGLRSMDLANKLAASMTRLVGRDQFPTRAEVGRQDPASTHSRRISGYQHAGADALTTEDNPNWRKTAGAGGEVAGKLLRLAGRPEAAKAVKKRGLRGSVRRVLHGKPGKFEREQIADIERGRRLYGPKFDERGYPIPRKRAA
jgi:hypothetical protein